MFDCRICDGAPGGRTAPPHPMAMIVPIGIPLGWRISTAHSKKSVADESAIAVPGAALTARPSIEQPCISRYELKTFHRLLKSSSAGPEHPRARQAATFAAWLDFGVESRR